MGRMYGPRKGMSSSVLPYQRSAPGWARASAAEVEGAIMRAAKKGRMPSQIGALLRDAHGVPLARAVTGGKILGVLRARGLAPELPEDLYSLVNVAIRKHLDRNRKDADAKFRLILAESRVHRLARYYRLTKKIPASFKYDSFSASTLVA